MPMTDRRKERKQAHAHLAHARNELRAACMDGGWRSLAGPIPVDDVQGDATYYTFENQGSCVAYVNHGGMVQLSDTLPEGTVTTPYPSDDDEDEEEAEEPEV